MKCAMVMFEETVVNFEAEVRQEKEAERNTKECLYFVRSEESQKDTTVKEITDSLYKGFCDALFGL